MFEFLKKSKKVDFALSPLEEQCIPYACHYDDHTVLTKNGELMQVIKIEGSSLEINNAANEFDLREVIRKSIIDNVTDRKIAIWFHTVRQKRNLDSINYYAWTFAKDTHEGWAQKNYWRDKFVNELYVTILYEGENYNTQKNFYLSFIPKALKKLQLDILAKNAVILDAIALKMIGLLKPLGGKRLQVMHDKLGAHSEILEFLSKIICLKSKRVALPIQSIDNIFCRSKVAFGGNSLEIIDEKDKHFAAVFSIKEYHEIPSKELDSLLRIASEYVISQTLNFIDSKEVKKHFEYFDYILTKVSKDEELRQHSGLESIIQSDKNRSTDYGTQQMTITIIGETLEDLQRSVVSVVREFKRLGIVVVREDLHIALCFWSQLPGNFHFFRRSSYINTIKTASFTSLHNTPSGSKESIWGKAITLFRRENAAPHFFNLHIKNNGHTLVVGEPNSSKDVLVNFLISESSKYDPNILYIDQFPTSRVVLKAIGGRHELISLKGEKAAFALNPFAMKDSAENREFLKNWILLLLFPNVLCSEEQRAIIFTAIDELMINIAVGSRQISTLLDFIEDESIKTKLGLWCKPNKLGLLFDHAYDELGSGAKVLGFNISELKLSEDPAVIPAFVSYCLHQYAQILDKTPTMIVLNDANLLLQDNIFTNMLPNWFDYLTTNNAISIFVCNSKIEINKNITNIQEKIVTKLFLPELNPKMYQEAFKLTAEEIVAIKNMKVLYRHFMIKQEKEIIIVELNLDGIDYAIKALTGKDEAIEAMEKAILEAGDNPNRWIVPFYRNLFPELQ